MKKIGAILLCVLLVLFCACGRSEELPSLPTNTAEPQAAGDAPRVDVDLTTLSSTMVYSEVYNMTTEPESYLGQSVRMRGSFATYHDEVADKYFFACLIADATACCSQGIEFVLSGEHKFPEDYPAEGTEITVRGTFGTYMDGGNRYCQLTDAIME